MICDIFNAFIFARREKAFRVLAKTSQEHHAERKGYKVGKGWISIGSDLFSHDEYIKQYLLDSGSQLITKIKIDLHYYITAQPDLILHLPFSKVIWRRLIHFYFFEAFYKYRTNRKI